jgi:hypothetical protein
MFDSGISSATVGLRGAEKLDAAIRFIVKYQRSYSGVRPVDGAPEVVIAQRSRIMPLMRACLMKLLSGPNAGSGPLRVAPVPGAVIDSWLDATASRTATPLGMVARAVDLPTTARPTWIKNDTPEQVDAIATTATDMSPNVVEAMTLSVYDGIALQLDPGFSSSRNPDA